MQEISNRLKELRDTLGITQTVFADSIGLGTSTVAMMEVGKREILDRHIKIVCATYNVNEKWFRDGIGDMFNVSNSINEIESISNKYSLTTTESQILQNYLNMNPDKRKIFTGVLLQLTNNTKGDSDVKDNNEMKILAASSGEI